MKPVTIIHPAIGESRDRTETIELAPGTQGRYRGHVPLGMVVLEIDGREWIVHPGATDID